LTRNSDVSPSLQALAMNLVSTSASPPRGLPPAAALAWLCLALAFVLPLASAWQVLHANMSLLEQGRIKGVRFDTLERICEYLRCQPGDLLRYVDQEAA
jgi:putative transcriptional regulator